jgi:hypothetical protein
MVLVYALVYWWLVNGSSAVKVGTGFDHSIARPLRINEVNEVTEVNEVKQP